MTENTSVKRKAIVYIDGFNLYFAINDKGWRDLLWLDLVDLAKRLIDPARQELVSVKYFTSPILGPEDKRLRQVAYLDALETTKPMLEIFKGHYLEGHNECDECGKRWRDDKEKQTDVNIAVQMVLDAHIPGKVDDMILITVDSDQCPAVLAVRTLGKRVLCVIPPGRAYLLQLQQASDSRFELTRNKLKKCLFPETVEAANGTKIHRPVEYAPMSAK